MKTKNVKVVLSAVVVMLMAWAFASCSKSDNPTPVVVTKTDLKTALDTANHYLGIAVEGNAAGDYTVGSKVTLQTATTQAQAVYDASTSTQAQVDGATTSLASAIAVFKLAIILPIAPTDLIAYWKFDAGTGTVLKDFSGNGHDGTLMAGHASAGGGPVPTWVADRTGAAAKALHFVDGGHVEVPASTSFVPTALSISVWIKEDSLQTSTGFYSDDYILAQNSYDVYKFGTQDIRKPLFTVHSTAATYLDEDTGDGLAGVPPTLYANRWYQIAATFDNGLISLYIDGKLARTEQRVAGTILSPAELQDFTIGVANPNAWLDINNTPKTYTTPHFVGAIDELRIYKIALTGAQITSIYNQEKP